MAQLARPEVNFSWELDSAQLRDMTLQQNELRRITPLIRN